ncbi:MAG: hypothetical protein EU533_05925 [Promethearchaeota archaeon]|nr:MAG: hypothetical protein EU533_05925 [Candidatus Lokiarchaeota archaeon]
MASYRLVIGIIIGICFSFITVFFFHMEEVILQIELYLGSDPLRVIIEMIGANFEFDIISFFTGTPSLVEFFAPQILATIFIGYLSGTIAKGIKRGLTAGTIVIIIDLLIWILLSVIVGEDLMALFQVPQLSSTIGGILSAMIGAVFGGFLGGLIAGPHEEF